MKLFSICFQSTSLRNNSNNLLQISHSLLFSMIVSKCLETMSDNRCNVEIVIRVISCPSWLSHWQ